MINSGAVRILAMMLSGAGVSGDVSGIDAASTAQDQQPTQPAPADAGPSSPDRDKQISALAALLVAALKGDGRPSAQIEGQLSLVISQAQSGCGDSRAALTQAMAQAGTLSAAASVAVRNVSGALQRCEIDGTAAVANAQTTLNRGTTLGLSGGSSNYIPQ
ncbi:hypothetical protein [Sphingomonas sp. CARO-RG-8B-R24-01]|uniref:hypothetical protein n=1 Tax=Sphingomonas sp. CARO-RG-8B-R24-01 TaxID=2914831 RepID=UPI001F590E76|nr:hypothetical protein [Sphingomonas sp. CARO-RG-8B-R24-01]